MRLNGLIYILALFITGCITSSNPFYKAEDITQNPYFIGTFESSDSGLTVTISNNINTGKHYLLCLIEGGKVSNYDATLFKINQDTFVDIMPTSEPQIMDEYKEGIPTASGLLKAISHDGKVIASNRLHVLFKLAISKEGIECFGAKKASDPSHPIKQSHNLKFHANGDGVVLEEPTEQLQAFVGQYGGTNWSNLFQTDGIKLVRDGK